MSKELGENGELKLKAMMVKWLNSFLDFYSTNGTMDAIQVAETVNLIIDVYPHYTMYDFKLFFKRAKLGNYGEIYGRVDGQVILSWLNKYDVQRDMVAQEMSINQARTKIPSEGGISWDEYCKRHGIKGKSNPIIIK